MAHLNQQTLLVLATVIFAAAVFLHLTKKNSAAIRLYMVQSAAIGLLLMASLNDLSALLIIAIVATVVVKIIIAPSFFYGLTRRIDRKFSAATYMNTPVTLLTIAALLVLTQSDFFTPLSLLGRPGDRLLQLAFGTILISILLSINRKGALSQILGILSLENGIVAFAIFAGLEQSPGFQLGITFNILIWVVIATVFASMIFRKFGSLDVTHMHKLKD